MAINKIEAILSILKEETPTNQSGNIEGLPKPLVKKPIKRKPNKKKKSKKI